MQHKLRIGAAALFLASFGLLYRNVLVKLVHDWAPPTGIPRTVFSCTGREMPLGTCLYSFSDAISARA